MALDVPVIGADEEIPPGSIITGFDYLLPASDDICQTQIGHSLSLGLPDVLSRQKLIIIANGPSARNVNLRAIKGSTLALNGAIQLFVDQGCQPTYWAACDPQELVADFIPDNPPKSTIYLVASKCHPAIFKKLKNRTVWLWHLLDHPAEGKSRVALASSVTISASWLMHRIGFTDFEYWGWDGCFMDGRHHASLNDDWSQVECIHLNYGGELKNGEIIGGRTFPTTRSWVAEADGAGQFFQLAKYFDIGIKINGDGMIEAARQSLMDKP